MGAVSWPESGLDSSENIFSKENTNTFGTHFSPLPNTLSDLYATTNNNRLVRNLGSRMIFGHQTRDCSSQLHIWTPMSIRNFPRNPKIALKKSSGVARCDFSMSFQKCTKTHSSLSSCGCCDWR